jgi:hypothetical protein
MKRSKRVALASALVAVSVASCSSSATVKATTATTSNVPSSFAGLAGRLLAHVPAGFVVQPDAVGATGPSNLAKAIRDDRTPTGAVALRSERFVRGYQRMWRGPGDSAIIVFVYQFANATGASQDFSRDRPRLKQAAPGGRSFTAVGIPKASSTGIEGPAQHTHVSVILFHTGPFNVQVVTTGPTATDLHTRVPLSPQISTDASAQTPEHAERISRPRGVQIGQLRVRQHRACLANDEVGAGIETIVVPDDLATLAIEVADFAVV